MLRFTLGATSEIGTSIAMAQMKATDENHLFIRGLKSRNHPRMAAVSMTAILPIQSVGMAAADGQPFSEFAAANKFFSGVSPKSGIYSNIGEFVLTGDWGMNRMRLRILSYEGDFGRIFYVVNVKTDKELEILKSFLNKKDAEHWKDEQESKTRIFSR